MLISTDLSQRIKETHVCLHCSVSVVVLLGAFKVHLTSPPIYWYIGERAKPFNNLTPLPHYLVTTSRRLLWAAMTQNLVPTGDRARSLMGKASTILNGHLPPDHAIHAGTSLLHSFLSILQNEFRVLATYLSVLRSRNAAVQSATLSSDSATLRFVQNLFTQDLNTFTSERYAPPKNSKWPQNAPFST